MNMVEELIKNINSDSKKKASFAAAEITELSRDHIDRLEKIKKKYTLNETNYSDYQTGEGILCFDDLDEKNIYLNYSNHWSYGGYCNETITVRIKDLIDFDYKKFEEERKNKKIFNIKADILSKEMNIEKLKQELSLLENQE